MKMKVGVDQRLFTHEKSNKIAGTSIQAGKSQRASGTSASAETKTESHTEE